MAVRMRRPATTRLELTQGDFLIVKQDLTAGEYREFLRGSTARGAFELDPLASGVALIRAYLLDWSFTDPDGRPLVIADQPPETVTAILDQIDHEAYMEVQRAIQTHQQARSAALEAEKKTSSGAPSPDRILTSAG
jgi:hypothetical protein